MLRTPAFIGEMLYGIFIYHIATKYDDVKIKELQLAFFTNTERINGIIPLLSYYLWTYIDGLLRLAVDPICPKGSKRRESLKDIFYAITPAKRRGIANPRIKEK